MCKGCESGRSLVWRRKGTKQRDVGWASGVLVNGECSSGSPWRKLLRKLRLEHMKNNQQLITERK